MASAMAVTASSGVRGLEDRLGERREPGSLVPRLVQQAANSVPAAQLLWDVAGDDEKGDATGGRLAECRERVGGPGTRCDEADSEPSGRPGQTVGGVCGGLLVAHGRDAQPGRVS